jgi:hypothetical protein
MSDSIPPAAPLSVTLQARQWQGLLMATDQGLQAIAALMAEIQRQCVMQQQLQQTSPANRPRPNGEERPDL